MRIRVLLAAAFAVAFFGVVAWARSDVHTATPSFSERWSAVDDALRTGTFAVRPDRTDNVGACEGC